jgi:uncharacterized iron-regulated protein
MFAFRLYRSVLSGCILILVCYLVQPTTVQAAHDNLIFRLQDLSQLSLDSLVEDLKGVRVVTIGEQHDNSEHHRAQLLVISALHEAGFDIAIGFEQFGARSQTGLDSWVSGRTSVEDLFQTYSVDWKINWWPLYLPIFQYAKEHEIPMVGLNIPREIVRQVASHGFSSLSVKQRGKIKVLSCNVDQKYQDTLGRVLGQKGKSMGDDMFRHFCEAQVVWDTSMALNAVGFIKANPDKALVILAGNFHSWQRGIPEQIRRVMDIEVRSIMSSKDTSFSKYDVFLEDADYVWWFE